MATRRPLRSVALAAALLAAAALVVMTILLQRADQVSPSRSWEPSVLTFAGDGVQGAVDGDAGRARFVDPFGVAVSADGTIYVADGPRIRRISRESTVSTVASGFGWLSALAIDRDGMLYVADTGNSVVTRVTVGPGFSPAVGHSSTPIAGEVDGNRPDRRLGVYALGYQVLLPDGAPAPGFERRRDTLVFDRMPPDHDAPRLVYAPGHPVLRKPPDAISLHGHQHLPRRPRVGWSVGHDAIAAWRLHAASQSCGFQRQRGGAESRFTSCDPRAQASVASPSQISTSGSLLPIAAAITRLVTAAKCSYSTA